VYLPGNGPSGICLSYFLSGHRPYVKESAAHPNPILHRKLQDIVGQSLLEQDLQFLCEGLEGRSPSPLALLFDTLVRPDGDLGGSAESQLTWRREAGHCVPHLVLGKGPPGGAWHSMEGSMFTLSLGDWMELPSMRFRDWMRRRGRHLRNDRATTRDIAQYYQHYVKEFSLQEHFVLGSVVTSVRPLQGHSVALDPAEEMCGQPGGGADAPPEMYEIRGFHEVESGNASPFCLYAQNVVLATGSYDSPSRLGVEGEDLPHVFHTIRDLERALEMQQLDPDSDPVLIVGAGLTAADAVLLARHSNVPVLHAFRRAVTDSGMVFSQLPQLMFPEYHKVHSMMAEQSLCSCGPYQGYTSLPRHCLLRLSPDRKCLLEDAGGKRTVFNISMAFILIGSNPNLSFLPDHGRPLALDQQQPISSKRNPLDTELFTYECVRQPGLYALGPLAGDNFVRFLQGGALGVAASLLKKM
ncbi:OSGI1 inhibitor, partial [Amia calva]|nr:OSGI1 inhibitor [Amia calva]